MKVKDRFLNLVSWVVNNGKQVRFWEDRWVGNSSLHNRYPSLYNTVRRRNVSIAIVFGSVPLNISFRRVLVGQNLVDWHNLIALILRTNLNDNNDSFTWNLHQYGQYPLDQCTYL